MTKRLSLFFFFLLFPGLFFYSSAVGAQLIPAVLGGGFGVFAAVTLVVLLPLLFVNGFKLRGKSLVLAVTFLALTTYCTVWLLIHHLLGDNTQNRPDVLVQSSTLIAIWLALFSIGYFWPHNLSKRYVYLLIACMVGMCAMVVLNVDVRSLIFIFGVSDEEGTLSYQGLARSTAMTGLVLLSVIRNMRLAVALACVLLITLFFIGARSELVAVVAVLPFIACLHFRQRPLATSMAAFVAALMVISSIAYFYDSLSNSRQFQLLDISDSTSAMARSSLQDEAVEAILESPVFGDFAGHARDRDEVGSYAHNVLSAWRQFGVLGFLLYLSLLLASIVVSIRQVRKKQYIASDLPRIAGTLSLFSLILMLAAKSVFWAFPALSWGLAVACLRQKMATIPREKPAKRSRRIYRWGTSHQARLHSK